MTSATRTRQRRTASRSRRWASAAPQAIKGGHDAIDAIDELTRQLYVLREQLVAELRQDEDAGAARVDAMLGRLRQERQS
jgi:hypothetical protein